jgi:hypothetical protein
MNVAIAATTITVRLKSFEDECNSIAQYPTPDQKKNGYTNLRSSSNMKCSRERWIDRLWTAGVALAFAIFVYMLK